MGNGESVDQKRCMLVSEWLDKTSRTWWYEFAFNL